MLYPPNPLNYRHEHIWRITKIRNLKHITERERERGEEEEEKKPWWRAASWGPFLLWICGRFAWYGPL